MGKYGDIDLFHLEFQVALLFFVLFCFIFDTGSQVAQDGFKLAM